jgi:hypothetical protein
MNREEEAKELRQFDIRIVERNIRRGVVNRKDYEKFLKSLPDVADKVAPHEAPETLTDAEPAATDATPASDPPASNP